MCLYVTQKKYNKKSVKEAVEEKEEEETISCEIWKIIHIMEIVI